MNTSQPPASKQSHTPSSGAEGWLLAPRAETETRTRAGNNTNGCATSPHGLASVSALPRSAGTYPASAGALGRGLLILLPAILPVNWRAVCLARLFSEAA